MAEVVGEERLALPPGDSSAQRLAESEILAALGVRLGVPLSPRRITLASGAYVEIDGVSDDPEILCEAWAHQGAPKAAQRDKVLADAFKLAFLRRVRSPGARLVLCFVDALAVKPFIGSSWYADALRDLHIQVECVDLPDEVRELIRQAQTAQFR
ncbi:MAG: hypothetical protein ACREOD_01345 [Candidatus Dormibacteria bacterium]